MIRGFRTTALEGKKGSFLSASSHLLGIHTPDRSLRTHQRFHIAGTLWCIEALTRAGEYDRPLLQQAVRMFEDFLGYSNHVGLFTEEVSVAGEGWVASAY
ncbi:hypothetical protein FRC20_002677 [Serendipita sp. 405]|nr:hypothetical protein FRC18_011538 [Serendipita sp. 400]KAG8868865.1 hypothetical protein FRC20_002677 [Serendipita sp. 405]